MAFIKAIEKPTGTCFYVYWRDHGKQKAKVFRDRPAAEAFFAEKDGTPPDPSAIPFDQFWQRYLIEHASRKLTPKVLRTYEAMGRRLLVRHFKSTPLDQIKRSDIPEWIAWAEREAGAGTVQKAFVVLSSCLTYAVRLDLKKYNPASGWGDHLPKVHEHRVRPHLTRQQVYDLADAVDVSFLALILSMGVLGLRPSAAIALQAGDLDLVKGTLRVHRSAVDVGREMVVRDTTKNRKERVVPLMGLQDMFEIHLMDRFVVQMWSPKAPFPEYEFADLCKEHATELLFVSRFSRQPSGLINLAALSKLVRKAGERIGVTGLSASDLRHVAATNIVEGTADLAFAQTVLGHSAATMTLAHYDSVSPGRWDAAIAKMTDLAPSA